MRTEEFGPYVVYEQIGLGGMATVHRAETQGIAGFSKQVALKRMLPSVAADASLVRSFIREARLASHLRHANVAQTYDLGKVGDTYFIAMELIPGRNLREILKHCAMVAGHMPLPIAMNIVNQIADALDYAHNLCDETGEPLGIIHRDVSPSNVIVSEGGVVKLIDFGIAKASKSSGMQTLSGTIKGKFSYMAPECLLGYVDARSDLFALGVIAYELLSNLPLFQGRDDMDTLRRVKDMPIAPPSKFNPKVPPEIDAIVMTALERDPDRRWQRATALREALTTETQRLGLHALNSQVISWIDEAFQRQFKELSEPSIMISRPTLEIAEGTGDELDGASDSLATLANPSGSRPVQAQQAPERQFDVATVAERPSERMAAQAAIDWNSPSGVETQIDRPAHRADTATEPNAVSWSSPSMVETREIRQLPLPAERRQGSPHVIARGDRPSSPPPRSEPVDAPPHSERLGSPQVAPPGPRSAPYQLPPMPAPQSGARTAPRLHIDPEAAQTDVNVSASAVLHAEAVAPVLADLEQRSSVSIAPGTSATRTAAEAQRSVAGNFLLALLVLIAAGGAAAVVYFALPYLT